LFGKTITLKVEPRETIFKIKTKIHAQEGIPIEEQHLIFDGIQLEDYRTLAYYRINARTVFYLDQSERCRGIICPLSNRIMTDPVIAADGYTYERSAIQERFDNGNYTSPITHAQLPNNNLIPNLALRQIIEHLCKQNPHLCR
jgi:ubiquitin